MSTLGVLPHVAVLDYGAGNIHSVRRALEQAGARVSVTSDPGVAVNAQGLLVPGVGAFCQCMDGIASVHGEDIIARRVDAGAPILGICVGMQILFEDSQEGSTPENSAEGTGVLPGRITQLSTRILPHTGWNTVQADPEFDLFSGLSPQDRFYFVHSYALQDWDATSTDPRVTHDLKVARTTHEDQEFVSAVHTGSLWATQFHPEKSGSNGIRLLKNWISGI